MQNQKTTPPQVGDELFEVKAKTLVDLKELVSDMKSGRKPDTDLLSRIKELEKQLSEAKRTKRYGLVWEEEKHKEKFETDIEKKLPVLEELESLAIRSDEKNTPENIIIEGDNIHGLAALSYAHKEKIDVIYIDPPYNTGNKDFIYNDDYVDKEDSFRHSKWLSFMSKRLRAARELLSENGVIFISIDDNQQASLKMLCDEIFDEKNFIANIIWKSKGSGAYDTNWVKTEHEYVLWYGKQLENIQFNSIKFNVDTDPQYKYEDEKSVTWGKYKRQALAMGTLTYSVSLDYPLTNPDWNTVYAGWKKGNWYIWRWKKEKVETAIKNWFAEWVKTRNWWSLYSKQYQFLDYDGKPIERSIQNTTIIDDILSRHGTRDFQKWMPSNSFSYPKPIELITKILKITDRKNSLVLDFFAGSGTTGHAVMELNKQDGWNRRFILVSNKENTKSDPDKNICRDITYERVKRVMKGYKNQKGKEVAGLGGNLRYFKTSFVPLAKSADDRRRAFMNKCTDLLRIRENCFSPVKLKKPVENLEIFRSQNHTMAVLYDTRKINELKRLCKTLPWKISVYVFSSANEAIAGDLEDIPGVKIETIPDEILSAYRTIFGF